jgi:hypothetical protein
MRNEFDDLTLEDVKIGGETVRDIIHDDPEPQEEVAQTQETEEAPVVETEEEVKEEVAEAPVDSFPSDRFGGKYKSWEEVEQALSQPKETEFKDDFIKKVVDKYNQDGNLEDFFRAYSTDIDKLSDQDILKKQFFEENADMEDEKAVERLWKKELSKYTIDADEYDQEEVETGLALMKRDAKKVRAILKERQQEYLQPSKKEGVPDDSKRIEALQKFVENDEVVKTVKESKIVSLDIDGEKFNFEVDNPQIIADSLINENLFFNQFVKDGKPDTGKWAEVMAYATNPQKFRKSLVDYGRSLERKSMEDELKNTKLPRQEASKSSSTGDDREDLLNAFVTKGKVVKR